MLSSISRMKSLIAPPLSSISKASHYSSLFPLPSKSKISPLPTFRRCPVSTPLQTPVMLSVFPFQNRCLQSKAFPSSSSGEIHVIIGPMFAGKTTTLLRRMQSESEDGRNVAIIKSNKDTRYSLDSIVTHDGVKLPCVPLSKLSSFRHQIGHDAYEKLDVIGIDEAQFFEDLYDFCREAADHDGKTVVVAGLDGDYLRRSFGSVLDIIPLADSVTKLTARCEFCGKRAFFTLRKTEESQVELIGGAEVYMPVCRHHYVSGQVVVEAARIVLESSKAESCV